MARYDVPPEVVRDAVRVSVTKVARLARRYARLGLRVLGQSRDEALIALPGGGTLLLIRRASSRRAPAAA